MNAQIIADIQHCISNHEILGNTAIVAEQYQELGYWERELASLSSN